LFQLVHDSADTSNSENCSRKSQQELEHFRGVQEFALSRAEQDRELSGFVFILVLDLDLSRADFISRPHRALRRDPRGLVADILVNFSEDAPPVPLKLVVLAGAQQVEHDATETKFCELILHKGLISISVVFPTCLSVLG
jgi:hypothetical protein